MHRWSPHVGRGEWSYLMAVFDLDSGLPRRMENMNKMISRLGLNPAAAVRHCAGAVLGSAVRICEACPVGNVCHDWLLRAAPCLCKAPAFCPNQKRFTRLLAAEGVLLQRTTNAG
jgi:Family of unknown function (DUF6455)